MLLCFLSALVNFKVVLSFSSPGFFFLKFSFHHFVIYFSPVIVPSIFGKMFSCLLSHLMPTDSQGAFCQILAFLYMVNSVFPPKK